ncbi:hypothetical protein H6F88_08760 [Oculatella sp. FACHB-28]|uniref:hypothetical protein n=1 Tax=Oculatella sp. FACHB-28 TaxID=2692845 RepID=UPI0016845A32|nr:hypothetical protein [Oculatella sp. FACHB-28]MBD2056106.1 hypothetical protein [Oculatella sp. FACHB-28]
MAQRTQSLQLAFAFAAGFIAVLVFHQGVLALLYSINFSSRAPYSIDPTQPFGIPQVWSLSFWGGVWGLILAAISPYLPGDRRYWFATFLFGAIVPTLVTFFIVAPLKGQPIATGGNPTAIITALLINGTWGIGTAWLWKLLSRQTVLN